MEYFWGTGENERAKFFFLGDGWKIICPKAQNYALTLIPPPPVNLN